jgi:hypothetical protein
MTSNSSNALVTPADDNFHALPGEPWNTETCWFSFNVPERNMAGWLYAWVRPNLHNCGGVFVYDPSGVSPWEQPYFQYQYCQPLPAERDLRDFTFPQNYSVRMLEPLQRYQLRYADREHIALNLEFNAICAPHPFPQGEPPFTSSSHFDQPGRVTGEIVLRGEKIAVDCLAVRDRSWGPRMDHRGSRLGYTFGTLSEQEGFCVFVLPAKADASGAEPIYHGYLLRDGRKATITSGSRTMVRNANNHIVSMQIEAVDAEGRTLKVSGTAAARMVFAVPRGTTLNSFLRFRFENGGMGHGEDQDVWRYDQWRTALQALRGASNA